MTEKVQNKQTPLETGKELVGKVLNTIPQKSAQIADNINMGFENLLQSFVEKLLVRKNIQTQEPTPEVVMNPPFLLGSEGEKQAIKVDEQAEEPKEPLLLGREG